MTSKKLFLMTLRSLLMLQLCLLFTSKNNLAALGNSVFKKKQLLPPSFFIGLQVLLKKKNKIVIKRLILRNYIMTRNLAQSPYSPFQYWQK